MTHDLNRMRGGWPDSYILIGRVPVATDWLEAAKWKHYNFDQCVVAKTDIDSRCEISTVFLGIDHRYQGNGDPLLFETMVFGRSLDGHTMRYATWAEAERGHAEVVTQAKIVCAQVKAITDKAGAT
jgi:hypothetical protein